VWARGRACRVPRARARACACVRSYEHGGNANILNFFW